MNLISKTVDYFYNILSEPQAHQKQSYNREIILQMVFEMDGNKVEYYRYVYHILAFLSDIGGLAFGLLIVFSIFNSFLGMLGDTRFAKFLIKGIFREKPEKEPKPRGNKESASEASTSDIDFQNS